MPHEWWHRTDVVDRGVNAFQDYVLPWGQRALQESLEYSPIDEQVPVVGGLGLEEALQGLEAIHQKGVVPAVSAPLQYIPLEWQQDAGVEPAPWYRPDLRFQQGSIQPTFDAYMKPEGGVSPSALLDAFTTFTGPGIAKDVMGEWFDFETNPQDTIRAQRIDEEASRIEATTGKPLTQRERREVGSDIYKLPPYFRGVAEELPYFAIPPARVARTALQGARAGQALSTTGRLGAAAPVVRTGLRGAEMALKPVELFERGAERAITAPFRATGAGIGAARRGIQNLLPDQPAGPRDPASLYGVQPMGVEEAQRNLARQIENQQAAEAADVARGARVEPEVATEPIETTIGIPDATPNQEFTRNFTPVDHDDWDRAKEILDDAQKPPTTADIDGVPDASAQGIPDADSIQWAERTIERLSSKRSRSVEPVRSTADIYGVGEASQQPQEFIRRRQTRGDNGHAAIEDSISTLVRALPRNFTSDTVTDLSKKLLDRFPNIATGYVEFMAKYWDSAIALRILEDANFRSSHPSALFNVVSTMKVPVADRVVRATGAAVARAGMRYTNFMRDTIEPFLARGATIPTIERYAQAKHWLILSQKARLQGRQLPDLVDPVTLEKIEVTEADLLNWTDRSWLRGQGFSDDAVDAVEKGAESIRDFYAEQRKRLLDEGIISQERFDSWRTEYPWYNPIQYLEFSDLDTVEGFGGGMNVTTDGIFALSPTANTTGEALGALPPLGEVMLKNIVGTELRITRNKITRDVVNMGVGAEIGLKDVSKEFTRQVTKTGPDGTKVTTTELKYVPYDDIKGVGYLSFYSNGERVVFGGVNGKEVPKWLWDTVNGRSGLALRSTDEVMQVFGMANGFFRSVYTTYNPLFFIRNGVIDSLTVMLKAGVLPTSTAKRLMVNLYKAARNSENRLIEVSQGSGAMSDRYYDVSGNYRRLTQELAGATAKQDGTIVSPNDTSGKKLNKILRDATNPSQSWVNKAKRFIPAVGSVVEQAPRLAVTEKAIKKYIGKREWKRLMGKDQTIQWGGRKVVVKGLTKQQFNDEMLNNWTPKFDANDVPVETPVNRGALVDTDEMQRAAQNGVEATLDFSRGGDKIRRWNNYVLFLNAAMEGMKLPFRTLGINLHPQIRPVKNPTADGPQFEFGSASEQLKNALPWQGRGVTGTTFDAVAGGPRGAALRIGMAVSTYWGIQTYWNKQFTYEGTPLYYDIPTYIRYNSIIFMLDSERDEFGDYILDPQTNRPVPKYIAIPHRLREWNLIFQSATLLDEETDKEVPMDKSKLGWELWKSTSPVSDIPMPELINAGLEEWQGFDYFRQAPIVDEELQGEPLEDQYNQWTSETARKAAGILDDVPAPDLIGDIIGSPQRLDHLYENVTGGVGKVATSMTDYAFRVADELRGVEDRPMEARVEEYREMTRRERTEFRASLTEEEYKEFQREIRMPKKETPFWDALVKSYYPQKGGGLYELSATLTEEATGVSVEETRKAGKTMGEVRIKVGHDQQRNDESLKRWTNRESGIQLSPKDWREEKSKKWSIFEGAELAIGQIYQKSIQNKSDEERDDYYTKLYNAAGQMEDIRTGADLLMAGYYAIEPEDSTETGISNTNWTDFFEARKQYLSHIKLASEASGDGMYDEVIARLRASMTPTEVAYDNSRQLLSSYWDVGRSVTDMYPNISPQYQQVWDNYLNADSGRRNAIYNESEAIQLLVKKRSELRKQVLLRDAQQQGYPAMELALVHWYGDFYDQPLTPEGKHYYNKLYSSSTKTLDLTPKPPVQGPQLPVGAR